MKYRAKFEKQILEAEANIEPAIKECELVQKKHDALSTERDEMKKMLSGGADAVKDIVAKTEKLEASLGDVQRQVDEVHKKVKAEEEVVANIHESASKVSSSGDSMRKQIKELEGQLEKINEDNEACNNALSTTRHALSST